MPKIDFTRVPCDRCLESYPIKNMQVIGDRWFCTQCHDMEMDIATIPDDRENRKSDYDVRYDQRF